MNLGSERLDAGQGLIDRLPNSLRGSQGGVPQPIMADHPVFVGIGDGASLEFIHRGERLGQARLDLPDELLREIHSADVETQADRGELCVVTLKPLPKIIAVCLCHCFNAVHALRQGVQMQHNPLPKAIRCSHRAACSSA